MSSAMHLGRSTPGYVSSDGKCLPCSGVSGRAFSVSPCSSFAAHGSLSQIKFTSLKCTSRRAYYLCRASSSGPRRNPDFSRHNRRGFSHGRNRQMDDRENFDKHDESDMLSSKNGPLLSLSGSTKSQATAVPGPREKEIVELFRKVQAQLRERAAMKEEKKNEAAKGQVKESETVDSLLKLLRKHSVEQAKRKSTSGSSREDVSQEQDSPSYEEKNLSSSFFDSNSTVGGESQSKASLSRPASKFRRHSPIPRVKYEPINLTDASDDSASLTDLSRRGVADQVETDNVPELDSEPEIELEPHVEDIASNGGVYDDALDAESSDADQSEKSVDDSKQELVENRDLDALKVPELRALAKSRGIKGFSKMKKSQLLDLLSGSSV